MTLSHRIELDATIKQRQYFIRAAGAARFVWNWALAAWNSQHDAGEKPRVSDLKRQFNALKYHQFPWLRSVHRDAHAQPFSALSTAFSNFFHGRGKHPKFKKKGRCRDTFYVANDHFRLMGRSVRLPIIGSIRMMELLRFSGKIQNAVVSREADRWFISISVEVPDQGFPKHDENPVGIDVGLTTFAALSTGEKIEAPKPLNQAMQRLRRFGRWVSRKKLRSRNRRKATMRLAKLHRRIRNVRKDFLHKLSTHLAKNHGIIGIEDLNVSAMLEDHHLARYISDAGWGEFRRQLEYKTTLYGSKLCLQDQFFASSKICCTCGARAHEMPLSMRVWKCLRCGAQHDRDLNAAMNLKPTTAGYAGSHACGEVGALGPLIEAGTLVREPVCAHER